MVISDWVWNSRIKSDLWPNLEAGDKIINNMTKQMPQKKKKTISEV